MAHLRLRLAVAAAALAALAGAGNAFAVGNITISEVYGGGGNSGATLTNDFIELHNRTAARDRRHGLVGAVRVCGRHDVAGDRAVRHDRGGRLLPRPGGRGRRRHHAAADARRDRLDRDERDRRQGRAGHDGDGAHRADCPLASTPRLRRLRTANCFEGTGPTGALSNTTAAIRAGNGNTDTDNNAADFTVGAPAPQNSGSGPTPPPPTDLRDRRDPGRHARLAEERPARHDDRHRHRAEAGRRARLLDPGSDARRK